jgi:hypothetical protein
MRYYVVDLGLTILYLVVFICYTTELSLLGIHLLVFLLTVVTRYGK